MYLFKTFDYIDLSSNLDAIRHIQVYLYVRANKESMILPVGLDGAARTDPVRWQAWSLDPGSRNPDNRLCPGSQIRAARRNRSTPDASIFLRPESD